MTPGTGIQIPCQLNLDSRFQSLAKFRFVLSCNPRQSGILNSGFHHVDYRFQWITHSLSEELEFQIHFKAQDFGFHEQKCLGFKKLDFLTYADIKFFFFSFCFALHHDNHCLQFILNNCQRKCLIIRVKTNIKTYLFKHTYED